MVDIISMESINSESWLVRGVTLVFVRAHLESSLLFDFRII